MSSEKWALRPLGTRLSSVFNGHESTAQEQRLHIPLQSHHELLQPTNPLSAPKLSNSPREIHRFPDNGSGNSDPNLESGVRSAVRTHRRADSPLLMQSSLKSLPRTLTKSRRKPPPGDEAELDSRASSLRSVQSPGSIQPRLRAPLSALADVKSTMGSELDQIMASLDEVRSGNLFLSAYSSQQTSPLHAEAINVDNSESSASSYGAGSYFAHHELPTTTPMPSAQMSTTTQAALQVSSSESKSMCSATAKISTPENSEYERLSVESSSGRQFRGDQLADINEQERPKIFARLPGSSYGAPSYYGIDAQVSPMSGELPIDEESHSNAIDLNTGTGNGNISCSNRNDNEKHDADGFDRSPSLPSISANRPDSMWTADSDLIEKMDLPADSYSDIGLNSFVLQSTNTQRPGQYGAGQGLQHESSFPLESVPAASEILPHATQNASIGRTQHHKLQLLLAWVSSAQYTSDTVNSSHFLSSGLIKKSHTRVSSTSSIISGSSRHVNLATIERSFSLRPGEGEQSNYVTQIRKSAGTSFNEAGPGKWKLPLGIKPLDARSMSLESYPLGLARFSLGSSNSGSRGKKSSGVGLKHGHLQPRLLAAEVEEVGDTNRFGSLGRSSTLQSKPLTPVVSRTATKTDVSSGTSRDNSLSRTSTLSVREMTVNGGSNQNKSRRASGSSCYESIGSLGDGRVEAYYQHLGYRCDDMDGDSENEYKAADELEQDYDSAPEEKPHLVLVNPDFSSNSEE